MKINAASDDLGNIVALEHVNLWVPTQETAMTFYLEGMGFTRDPYFQVGPSNMWVNVGTQQFHFPTRGIQVMPGHIGIIMRNLPALEHRLNAVRSKLSGTQFDYSWEMNALTVVSPWGNRLRCHEPADALGSMTLGIAYVEVLVRPGTAASIARFYKHAFDCRVESDESELSNARVEVGNNQVLIFKESREPIREYDGHHIAVYVSKPSKPYHFLLSRDLITEAIAPTSHQFRFRSIVDPDTGRKVLDLEHEVRSMRHPMFLRPLVNRPLT